MDYFSDIADELTEQILAIRKSYLSAFALLSGRKLYHL